jgi:hypothetical protein
MEAAAGLLLLHTALSEAALTYENARPVRKTSHVLEVLYGQVHSHYTHVVYLNTLTLGTTHYTDMFTVLRWSDSSMSNRY